MVKTIGYVHMIKSNSIDNVHLQLSRLVHLTVCHPQHVLSKIVADSKPPT
jgi:hypothetical protein